MRDRLVRTFGFQLAFWYSAIFVAGAALILLVAYALLSWSLAARDREIIESTLTRYAVAYQRGGLRALDAAIAADRAGSRYEPLLVRVVTPAGAAVYFSIPEDWNRFDMTEISAVVDEDGWGELRAPGSDERLMIATRRVGGRTLFQVGRSTQLRDELLARFRGSAFLLFAVVVAVGLAVGRALSRSALTPLRELAATVRTILEGGSTTTSRVPVRPVDDELDELGLLMNRMLDRIDGLITAMRSSLDLVAHDLRTPVTRLRASAETSLRSARTEGELRAALAEAVEESDRLMTMLDALMDVAEAEAGTMALNVQPIDLAAIVRDAADLYRDVAEAKGVQVSADVPERIDLAGDPNRLAQAIANVLDNAVKYTPSGGTVSVSAAREGSGAVVTVTDTGIGIPADELPRIWERLFRGDRSRSARGLGLGLSLVKAIVESHGGRAEVESTPGAGSTFRLYLPAEPPNMTRV